jgi:integrase
MKTKLNQKTAEAITPTGRTFVVYDETVPGFGCRVSGGGVKAWVFEYRPGGGRRSDTKRMTLGRIDALPYHKARDAAEKQFYRSKLGADPAGERDDARNAPTVTELIGKYLAEAVAGIKQPTTERKYRDYFRNHVCPALGTRRARDVTFSDVTKLHRAIGTRARPTANRVVALIHTLFKWGVKAGELPASMTNPASGVDMYRETARERYLTDDELKRLGATLALAETAGLPAYQTDESQPTAKHNRRPENRDVVVSAHATNAIRLLILTGCRIGEILKLRWKDVDTGRATFKVNGKTGQRSVFANAATLAVLEALAEIRIGDFVVAGDDADQPRADLNKPWERIRRHAKIEDVHAHDLRHTHASIGAAAGFGLPVIGALLGHKDQTSTHRYTHVANDPARRASEAIGAALAAAMGGPSAEVIRLPAKVRAAR